MKRPWFTAQAADGHIAVSIRGPIGELGESDTGFIDRVQSMGEAQSITLTINSRGGEVDHALAIFNFLRTHPARVTVRIDGIAASAASIIAMAGDEIIMPANALMMVHSPWVVAAGSADELRKAASDLDKFEAALIATYVARTQRTEDDVKAMLSATTWMTAEEAVAEGFADKVEPITRAYAVAMAEAAGIPAEVLSRLSALESPVESLNAPNPAAKNTATARAEVATLCAAAARADLVDVLMPLALASGVDAVRATLLTLPQLTGIQSALASNSHPAPGVTPTASEKLAHLALQGIYPKPTI